MNLNGPITGDGWMDVYANNTPPDEKAALEASAERLFSTLTPQQVRQTEMVASVRDWWSREHRTPALTVRCSALRRGKPCRATLANIYATPAGMYIRFQHMPKVDLTLLRLEVAQNLAANGDKWLSKRVTESAGERMVTDELLEMLDPGWGGRIPIGCTAHGDTIVTAVQLIEEAGSKRRTFNLDCTRKPVR